MEVRASSSSSWNSLANSGDSSREMLELLEDRALSNPLSPSETFLFLVKESIDQKLTPDCKYSREVVECFCFYGGKIEFVVGV